MHGFVIALHPHLAEKFGINRALVLCQMYYLTTHPPYDAVIDDSDQVWIPRTYAQWESTFLWLSASGIRKVFDVLRATGLIAALPGEYENSYALTEAGLALFEPTTSDTPDVEADIVSEKPVLETLPTSDISLSRPDSGLTLVDSPLCPAGASLLYNKRDSKEESSLSPTYTTLLEAFCDICELNPALKPHRTKVERYVRELWQAGYCAEDMECVRLYWENDDYRSGRIYPKQVVEIVEAAVRKYGRRSQTTLAATDEVTEVDQPSLDEFEALPQIPQTPAPRPAPDLHWYITTQDLESRLGKTNYDNWIHGLEYVSYADDVLTLKAVAHKRDYLVKAIAYTIAARFSRIKNVPVKRIVFIADNAEPLTWVETPKVYGTVPQKSPAVQPAM